MRDDLDDLLDDALRDANLGEVTGGGQSDAEINFDVEVTELAAGLEVIKGTLKRFGAPASTTIRQFEPEIVVYRISD